MGDIKKQRNYNFKAIKTVRRTGTLGLIQPVIGQTIRYFISSVDLILKHKSV
jgi:hypothetical protein